MQDFGLPKLEFLIFAGVWCFFCSHLPFLFTSVETDVLITYLITVYVLRNQITKLGLWVDAHAALLLLENENSMISWSYIIYFLYNQGRRRMVNLRKNWVQDIQCEWKLFGTESIFCFVHLAPSVGIHNRTLEHLLRVTTGETVHSAYLNCIVCKRGAKTKQQQQWEQWLALGCHFCIWKYSPKE